jgi:hypothetical protein
MAKLAMQVRSVIFTFKVSQRCPEVQKIGGGGVKNFENSLKDFENFLGDFENFQKDLKNFEKIGS